MKTVDISVVLVPRRPIDRQRLLRAVIAAARTAASKTDAPVRASEASRG